MTQIGNDFYPPHNSIRATHAALRELHDAVREAIDSKEIMIDKSRMLRAVQGAELALNGSTSITPPKDTGSNLASVSHLALGWIIGKDGLFGPVQGALARALKEDGSRSEFVEHVAQVNPGPFPPQAPTTLR